MLLQIPVDMRIATCQCCYMTNTEFSRAVKKAARMKIGGMFSGGITAKMLTDLAAYKVRTLPESQRLYREVVSAAGVRSFLRIK